MAEAYGELPFGEEPFGEGSSPSGSEPDEEGSSGESGDIPGRSIRFFIRNRWTRSGSLISSSGETTDHEDDLTKSPALAETWRSSSLSGAYISADLISAYKISAVCLVRCNLSNNGLYRIRISNSSDFTGNVYDSGWIGRKRYFSDAEIILAKTSEFFTAGLPISDIQKRIQRQVMVVPLAEVTGQYVRIDFDDATNPDGYLEVGYVYVGRTLEPDRDLMYGWKMQRDDFVREGQAACGQYWPSSVYNKTLVTFTMAPQRESDMMGYWFLLESLVGINDEFIVSLFDRSDTLLYTTTIYGKFTQVPNNANTAFRTWAFSAAVEELID